MFDQAGYSAQTPAIHYWSAGQRGPRVLFIMGFGMRGDLWQPQLDALRDTHQVAWYDHRGLGESQRGRKPLWTMRDMAGDALSVLDALGWEQAHLVGVSMGGMVAQELALDEPERFLSLSLLVTHSGGHVWRKVPPTGGLKAFAAANTKKGPARAAALTTLLYPDHYLATLDRSLLRQRIQMRVGRPVPATTILAQLHAILRHDTRRRLKKLTLPTLVVKAGQDVLVQPRSADRLMKALPNAKLLDFADAGHGVIWQKAKELNGALGEHFANAEPVGN